MGLGERESCFWRGLSIAAVLVLGAGAGMAGSDWRNIRSGDEIPSENYADQPYVVLTRDGRWFCTLTTGRGAEGQPGQHIIAMLSADQGKSWSEPVDIEPADGPEASWAMPLVCPSGRIYVFYDYNGDNVRTLPDGRPIRADMLGWYCYRYSDDNGRTWSRRYRLPVRQTACDRGNDWGGKVQILWGIGKPITVGESVLFGFTKLGRYMLEQGEGWFFRSDNILTESDPSKICWEMLPVGQFGLRCPQLGSAQEEHNLVALEGGDLFCMYRTARGHPAQSYSRDGGRSWSEPEPARYRPGGRVFKHPRACPRIWRTREGRFLFWFHNHGGKDFKGRNPGWICGGIEKNGYIYWSQPEVLLYDPDPSVRISYPDLIEQGGQYWITETEKRIARVHRIDPSLLEGLWRQGTERTVSRDGLVVSLEAEELTTEVCVAMPKLADLAAGGGFTIELWVRFERLAAGQVLIDSRGGGRSGVTVVTTAVGTVELVLCDGVHTVRWDCDRGLLKPGKLHQIAFVVDGGPRLISVMVDGVLCDGRRYRRCGWRRFGNELGDVTGGTVLKIGSGLNGRLERVRIYRRYLRNFELVGSYLAGAEAGVR